MNKLLKGIATGLVESGAHVTLSLGIVSTYYKIQHDKRGNDLSWGEVLDDNIEIIKSDPSLTYLYGVCAGAIVTLAVVNEFMK